MSDDPTAGILLAAGMSTRFGGVKALAGINGCPMMSMVVSNALNSVLDRIVLVLGHKARSIMRDMGPVLSHPKLETIINPDYRTGMSASLKCGVSAVKARFPSVMILLGDQPLLQTSTINHVLAAFRTSPKPICQAVHADRIGHPVCFARSLYADLLAVTGDQGARDIIKTHPDQVLRVTVDDPAGFLDVDYPTDLERVKSHFD